jgi:hypothetical protein
LINRAAAGKPDDVGYGRHLPSGKISQFRFDSREAKERNDRRNCGQAGDDAERQLQLAGNAKFGVSPKGRR